MCEKKAEFMAAKRELRIAFTVLYLSVMILLLLCRLLYKAFFASFAIVDDNVTDNILP